MSGRRLSAIGLVAVLAASLAGFSLFWHPALAPIDPPVRASFTAVAVRHGRELAALGFCSSCHGAGGGNPYAGGRALPTPFGVLYSTNITPDAETGIGRWSLSAFTRALREGIDRDGHQLYPALPYTHFTHLTDGDIADLYAFLMTREPVRASPPPNRLRFPYDHRFLVAGWNLLFLREGPLPSDPSKDEAWNRGHYLGEALSHCGACHTPRNALGAEEASRAYAGGEAEGWWSPPLNHDSPSPTGWTQEALHNYLRSWDKDHAGGAGPMGPVVWNLGEVPDDDVRALAAYTATTLGLPAPDAGAHAQTLIDRAARDPAAAMPGATVYAGACATCHDSGGQVPWTLRSLALHSSVQGPTSANVVRSVAGGIKAPDGHPGPFMPPFAGALTPRQIADVAVYVRARFSDKPAWTDVDAQTSQALADPEP